ncbi:MAG: hybrid sensor histidine kinase/response regulator [Chloroflexi bacterium]|nr:MAG: hybrid sensor histidine kinase/response regulator [Chloroflexota bacterium]
MRSFLGRIGTTLVLVFLIIAILPTVVLSAVATSLTADEIYDQQIEVREIQAAAMINNINRWLDNARTTLDLLLANNDQLNRMAIILGSSRPLTTAINQQAEFFSSQLAEQENFSEFFLFNRDGIIRVSTDPDARGSDVTQQPYFIELLRYFDNPTEEEFMELQPLYYDDTRGIIQMLMFRPIQNEYGVLVGILAGRLDLTILNNILSRTINPDSPVESYLVAKDGSLLVTSNAAETIGYHANSQAIDEALQGIDGRGTYVNYRGNEVIGVYHWIPELQAALLSEVDRKEALDPVVDIFELTLITAVGTVIVVFGVGIGVTIWLTRPINSLTETAVAVSRGDYTKRTQIKRKNELGQLSEAFNTMTDKLVNSINDLDRTVNELSVAKEKAEESVRLKDEFLAVMSHELRTPLNASIGFLGLLQMGDNLSDDALYMVQRARANNERLLELINNILDLSRIEAGRMKMVREEVNIRELVDKISKNMQILADQKSLSFLVEIDESVPDVVMQDIDALNKILTNLLSNAFKFTEKGKVHLKVTLPDDNLQLIVEDTGIGIPVHKHETIFESFRQVDASTSRVYGGSGLGLSIVQRLCIALGGAVRVESEVGQGSKFIVTLPMIKQSEVEVV